MSSEVIKLKGLILRHSDDGGENFTEYDIGALALHALHATQKAVLMAEQIVTGDKIVKALDIADFYASLNSAIEEDNGQGILSEAGETCSIQDELQGLVNWVNKARSLSSRKDPHAQGTRVAFRRKAETRSDGLK